jgi:hypothetical protein
MPYVEYYKVWHGTTLVQDISWEYGTTFTDASGYRHDATPTFRTTSSDADVSATPSTFQPVSEARAPASSLSGASPFITSVPPITGSFTTDTTSTFPGAQIIQELADATGTPSQLPLTIVAGFIILAFSLLVSALMRERGGASLIVKSALIACLMGICVATTTMDFWMIIFFVIFAIAFAMGSQQRGWD